MPGLAAANRAGLVDDVVGVEVTIDGMLVIADRLQLIDFPVALGIRQNIPQDDLRKLVWDQVRHDLNAQGVLDHSGAPHPAVADMVDALSRPDRTLEGRWWRRDLGGKMVRFVVCRNPKGMPVGVDPLTGAGKELHRCRTPQPRNVLGTCGHGFGTPLAGDTRSLTR